MKKTRKTAILAALTALTMVAAVGCGYVDDVEEEKDGAGLIETKASDQLSPDSQETEPQETEPKDETADSEEDQLTDSQEETPDEDSETESETDSAEDSADDTVTGDETDETGDPTSGEGESYHNDHFGMTVPLPGFTAWTEYHEGLMPDFEDASAKFRPLMETENTDDCVLNISELQSGKTLDDYTKAAWDRDYRNAGESEDKYEVMDTQVLQYGGYEGQLITEKLTSSNGEFWYGTVYISLAQGEYIKFRVTCLTEEQLSAYTECIKNVTFDDPTGDNDNA